MKQETEPTYTWVNPLAEMQKKTIQWAKDAGFYDSTTPEIQLEKLKEEAQEIVDANSFNEFFDAIGDTMVCIFIQAGLRGYTLKEDYSSPDVQHKVFTRKSVTARIHSAINSATLSAADLDSMICDLHVLVKNHTSYPLAKCFDIAYTEIQSRVGKGKVVNGIFIKEADL